MSKTIAQLIAEAIERKVDATIGDVVDKMIEDSGLQEALGVEIETSDGATTQAQTIEHPIMNAPAGTIVSMKIKQSAEGG